MKSTFEKLGGTYSKWGTIYYRIWKYRKIRMSAFGDCSGGSICWNINLPYIRHCSSMVN